MVLSLPLVQLVILWDVLNSELGLDGGLISIKNGPRCNMVAFQLPAKSPHLIWKYQLLPSASAPDVSNVRVISAVVSGTVVADVDHSYEYPAIPLILPSAPLQSTEIVLSLLQTLVVCDEL